MEENLTDRSGETVEKFKLERLLGEGGMGQVYLAQHQITDRWVAVKILHQEFAQNKEILQRIRREAKAAALIGHPNIVEIIDSGVDQYQAPFIAMELLEGESLDDFLERMGPLSVPMACYIVADICDTLAAAHEKGVVHRDMKPENVFMQNRHKSQVPQVKILDFGISKFLTMDQQDMSLTKTGTVMGTPYYMSVEQAMGQKVDGRADIYSVGVILYQLLTARLPYYDTNYNRVLLQIVAGDHVPVIDIRPDLPPELSDIIEFSMAKNRDERYSTSAEFRQALLPFCQGYDLESMFSSQGGEHPVPAADLPLQTTTPPVTDPGAIKAALASTAPSLPSTTVTETTGEVVLPSSSKGMLFVGIFVVAAVLAVGGWFLFGRGKGAKHAEETPANPSSQTGDATGVQVAQMTPPPMDMPPAMTDPPMLPMDPVKKVPKQVFLSIVKLPKRPRPVVRYDGKILKFPYKIAGDTKKHTLQVTRTGYQIFRTTITPDKQNIVVTYAADRIRSGKRPMIKRPMPLTTHTPMTTMKVVMKVIMKTTMKTTNMKYGDTPDF